MLNTQSPIYPKHRTGERARGTYFLVRRAFIYIFERLRINGLIVFQRLVTRLKTKQIFIIKKNDGLVTLVTFSTKAHLNNFKKSVNKITGK